MARAACVAVVLVWAPLSSAAANPCASGLPEGQSLLLPVPASQRDARDQVTQASLTRLARCEDDADFLTRLGASLNTLGRFEEALEHLERALLLRPDEPLARYSYAWALHELGDAAAALELLTTLSPWAAPSAQRDPLARARAQLLNRIQPGTATAIRPLNNTGTNGGSGNGRAPSLLSWSGTTTHSRWLALGQVTTGHETNLLGAPRASSLNLTITGLPSGETVTINVPLDEAVRPRPGPYQQALGQLRWQLQSLRPVYASSRSQSAEDASAPAPAGLLPPREWRLWQWDALVALRHRQASTVEGAGFTQADAALDLLSRTVQTTPAGLQPTPWATAWRWPDSYATLGATALNSQSGVRYASAQAAAGWQVPLEGACDLRLGAEMQERRFQRNPTLNGRYGGAVGALRCSHTSWPGGRPGPALQLQLRAGQDRPQDETRPGGTQTQLGWRLSLAGARTLIEIDQTHQRDATAYSALIEPGTNRQLRRTIARAEWAEPLKALQPAGAWQVVLGAETSQQESNIVLFDTRNAGVYLSLRAIR